MQREEEMVMEEMPRSRAIRGGFLGNRYFFSIPAPKRLPVLCLLLTMLSFSLSPSAYSHEDPRGDVYPLVKADKEFFRVSYLINDARFSEQKDDADTIVGKERSVLMVEEFSADGAVRHEATPGPVLCTTRETDRMYGREIGIEGTGNGFLRSDGFRWYLYPTFLTKKPEGKELLVLMEFPWLHRDSIELPWCKTTRLRSEPGEAKVIRVAHLGDGLHQRELIQFHIDRQYAIFILSPLATGERSDGETEKTVLLAFRRLGNNEFRLVHKQGLGTPIIYSNVGVPCIRLNGDKYYVAYLVPTALPHAADKFPPSPADIMLLEWVPKTGRARTTCLATKIDWNTHLSFGLIGDRGLLAYHQASARGDDYFRVRSRIVTKAFDVARLDWRGTGRN